MTRTVSSVVPDTERVDRALALVPPLQPTEGVLASTPDTVRWGWLPVEGDAPVLEVDPGSIVCVDTVSHEGILADQGRDPRAFFAARGVPRGAVLQDAVALAASDVPNAGTVDGPHVVTGPIAVRGAQPGDVLSIHVVDLVPRVPYGVVSSRHGLGALPGEVLDDGETFGAFCCLEAGAEGLLASMARAEGSAGRVRFPIHPFLGLMGVVPAGPGPVHSVAPGAFGGNIDVRLLTAGTTLHLPVQVAGALAYVGDPHYAQGDGEVALTALEAPLRATLRLDLIAAADAAERFGPLAGPLVETPDLWVPTGLDVDLDEAMRAAVRASISLLGARYDMDRRHALAYLSAAADFSVSQVVDSVKGIHAAIRKADFG